MKTYKELNISGTPWRIDGQVILDGDDRFPGEIARCSVVDDDDDDVDDEFERRTTAETYLMCAAPEMYQHLFKLYMYLSAVKKAKVEGKELADMQWNIDEMLYETEDVLDHAAGEDQW